MFKIYTELGLDILQDVLPINSQPEYFLTNKIHFATQPIRTVHYGDNSLRYLGLKLWELIPSDMKERVS